MTVSRSTSDVELYGLLPDGGKHVTIAFTDARGVDHKLVAGIGT